MIETAATIGGVLLASSLGGLGWCVARLWDQGLKIAALEANQSTHKQEQDRRFGDVADQLRSVNEKLDRILENGNV